MTKTILTVFFWDTV